MFLNSSVIVWCDQIDMHMSYYLHCVIYPHNYMNIGTKSSHSTLQYTVQLYKNLTFKT